MLLILVHVILGVWASRWYP